jgi:hypothetical protein
MLLGILTLFVMGLVLTMGTVMMELLFRDAPRRGKRPDISDDAPNSETIFYVTTTDGETISGKPLVVAQQLIAEGFAPAPRHLTAKTAEQTLLEWERQGMVRIRGAWAESTQPTPKPILLSLLHH